MTKIKAVLIQILISLVIISIFALVVFYIWYPKPFVEISGVLEPLKLLVIVNIIIGPMLTFIVYKKDKKHLRLDLSLIVLMQIVALGYGIYTIYNGRPSMLVMHNGEFYYLSVKFSNHSELKFDELKPSIFTRPKMAYISKTQSVDIYSAYSDMLPIENYDETLLPFSGNVENMQAKFKNKTKEIDLLVAKYNSDDIAFFQLDKEGSKYSVVYSKSKNAIVDYLKF